jgi:restriction system protein
VTKKRVGELQRGVFKILLDHSEGLPAKEVIDRMRVIVPPTDFEKSDYPSRPGVQRFRWMVRFATIAPVKAGWMIKDKGKWYLTDERKQAFLTYKDPVEFRRESGRLYHQWVDSHPKDELEVEAESPEVPELIEKDPSVTSTYEEAEETAWSEIEQYVQSMNPYDLQKLEIGRAHV